MFQTIGQYLQLAKEVSALPKQEKKAICRKLCRTDLYFLLWYVLRADYVQEVSNPEWVIARCKDVQEKPNNFIDLWARDHFKSTIITFAKSIQDILITHGEGAEDREVTIGIFSFVRPVAKSFLRQIKREFESNELLRWLFDDVIWENPHKEAPKWSEDDGIVLKRKSNPKESTVEAWGLVDGQPTSRHFSVCVYDDIISREHVRSPEMIKKVNEAWELSINLGTEGGARRYIGTRYHTNDIYNLILTRKVAKARIHPCTNNGQEDGVPVLRSREEINMKRQSMDVYTFSAQMLQNPISSNLQVFKPEWVQYYDNHSKNFSVKGMNLYICVDPANAKKTTSDYTAMMVIGLAPDNNYYLLDIIRDRLDPAERIKVLIQLHMKWSKLSSNNPKVVYEQYGMMTDGFYLKVAQEKINYRFPVVEVGGKLKKEDRIKRLVPLFEGGRFYLPKVINYTTIEGKVCEMVKPFIDEELLFFPVGSHDDMLDALARVLEPEVYASFPKIEITLNRVGWTPDDDNSYNQNNFMSW